jgi:acyl-coenzyme A synthetase/AMP-(fatty) acid ligase
MAREEPNRPGIPSVSTPGRTVNNPAFNNSLRPLPAVGFVPTVSRLLARAVGAYSEQEYLITPAGRITFGEAERRSAELARQLIGLGAGKGTRIAILYPSSPEFVVAFLAVARVGALAVLVPSTVKGPELRTALRLSDAAIAVARARFSTGTLRPCSRRRLRACRPRG